MSRIIERQINSDDKHPKLLIDLDAKDSKIYEKFNGDPMKVRHFVNRSYESIKRFVNRRRYSYLDQVFDILGYDWDPEDYNYLLLPDDVISISYQHMLEEGLDRIVIMINLEPKD